MENDFDQQLDRCEFIRKIMRYLISSVLGISAGALILKRIMASDDEKCLNHFICQDCAGLFDCNLPSALKLKENPKGVKYAR